MRVDPRRDEECCLHRGATSAALIGELVRNADGPPPEDSQEYSGYAGQSANQSSETEGTSGAPKLHLQPGDVLIFEEVIGPKTGNPSDADPGHRHAVRLTHVEAGVDSLNGQAIVEISWAPEDALPFPLCISALGPAPTCEIVRNVSVVRGNVILVDHGRTIEEDAGSVPVKETVEVCDCENLPSDTMKIAGRFRPTLKQAPLTFAEPLAPKTSASRALAQDVRKTRPSAWLAGDPAPSGDSLWIAEPDLLASSSVDQHFVAEVDDDGRAHLRFGNGELGRSPAPDTKFKATYRAGNGTAGNVGAESIAHIVFRRNPLSGGITRVRNPLAGAGGTNPEPVAEAKLFAPHAFRQELQRAIVADDYRALVERDFSSEVQRAAASLRWNGSRYEALIAVDEIGKEEADHSLLAAIYRRMHRYRRIGHDIHVTSATLVPLLIEMHVCVQPHYLRGHVKSELLDLFSNRVLAGGRKGFFHPDNLSFGEGIYLSRLIATAQAVEGVESVVVTRLERLGAGPNREIEFGLLPLGPLEVAQVDNDPSLPENGTFTLKMGGGR
jgi:hypothetical protein